MSLINQMLQDLESRQVKKQGDGKSDFADGLNHIPDYKAGKGFLNKRMIIYLVIFVIVLGGLFIMRSGKKPAVPQTKAAIESVKPAAGASSTGEAENPFLTLSQDADKVASVASEAAAVADKAASVTSKTTTKEPVKAEAASATTSSTPTQSTGQELAGIEDSGETDVVLDPALDAPAEESFVSHSELVKLTISPVMKNKQSATFYFNTGFKYEYSTSDNGDLINLVFENAEVPNTILPKLEQNSYITEVGFLKEYGSAKFIFDLADGVVVTGLEADKTGFPQKLTLNLSGPGSDARHSVATNHASDASDPSKKMGEMSRVTKPPTPQEQLQLDYEDALNDLKQNKVESAMNKLRTILEAQPDHLQSRSDLMMLYLEKRDYQSLQVLLADGFAQNPTYPPFVMMQARLFMLQQDNQQALAIMKSVKPDLKEYPDFYATLASLEQDAGSYQVAAQIYLELIRIEPSQGRWWLGYGLALEALGKRNVALQAYEKSINSGTLTINLEAFVKGRIDALGD